MENKPLILIGCPIRNREFIVERYLSGIYNLNYPKDRIILYWLVNDSRDHTLRFLEEFKIKHKSEYKDIVIEKIKNNAPEYKRAIAKNPNFVEAYWKQVYTNLANLRNKVIDKVLEFNVDYYFGVDSDIIVNSEDLNLLLSNNKDVVAGIINNDQIRNPSVDIHMAACNILNFDEHDKAVHIKGWEDDKGLIAVDITGAIALYNAGIYKKYKNLKYEENRQGEDIGFFRIAREFGIKSYADPRVQPLHYMGTMQVLCMNCKNKCKQFSFQDGERKGVLSVCPKYTKGE
jgi:hypothetical protein